MLRILGRANSINVRRVLWLCEELGLPYVREDYGRGFRPTDTPEFKAVSRFGVVPVIVDDGFVLRESNTICRYLAVKHGAETLYPKDPRARAVVEQGMDWAATDLYSALRPVFLGLQVKMEGYTDPVAIARGIKDWTKQMTLLGEHLAADGPFMAGGQFTLADMPAGLCVNRWYGVAFDKPEIAPVKAYYELLSQRPAYLKHGRNGTP